jgi:hypothetical protein
MQDFPKSFRHDRDQTSESIFRCSMSTLEDIEKWIAEYSLITKTAWVTKKATPAKGKKFVAM